ncbi:MAG: 30S ribosomal protein S8 [Candidatus Falkowbacteria bacterium]|nr:30S ribosomal protein S8 [Candidatus Falkowbacteria bacterium]
MTDPIADMLTRIRNASAIRQYEVVLPMSKIKHEVAQILKREGWVNDVQVVKAGGAKNKAAKFDQLRIMLKYKKSGRPAIASIKRVSKPGLRIYAGKNELPRVLNNLGIAIISTPQGLMTNKEASRAGLGGEVICEVY